MLNLTNELGQAVLLVSVLVSIAGFIVKRVVEQRIKAFFAEQIEKLKKEHSEELIRLQSSLERENHAQELILAKRFEVFRAVAELAYHSRNLAHDLENCSKSEDFNVIAQKFHGVVDDYRKALEQNVIFFEDDDFLTTIHPYKLHLQFIDSEIKRMGNPDNHLLKELKHLPRGIALLDQTYPLVVRALKLTLERSMTNTKMELLVGSP